MNPEYTYKSLFNLEKSLSAERRMSLKELDWPRPSEISVLYPFNWQSSLREIVVFIFLFFIGNLTGTLDLV